FFTMMSAFAELEANLLSERTKKGLESARSRGRMGGRPKFPKDKRETVISLYESEKYTINEIIRMTGVSRGTIYNIVNSKSEKRLNDDIRSYKEEIIVAILSNELIKDTYSLKLASSVVFKVEDFISLLRFKNYWDNSYTKYTNEIGLTSENKYLKYNTDVILDF